MKVAEFKEKSGFECHANEIAVNKEINGVFVGDLLSWVMGHAEVDNAWITVQGHLNIVAVAALKEISCLIVVGDAEVPAETLQKADEEDIAIFNCSMSAYEASCLCHDLGL